MSSMEPAEIDEDGQVHVTVTYAYEPWCCNGAHELVDACKAATYRQVQEEDPWK